MRYFRITVGNIMYVRNGVYFVQDFDMNKVFIKSFGYDSLRIYDHQKTLLVSIRLDSLPGDGHLCLRKHLPANVDSDLKRLVFVLSTIRSRWKIINTLTGLLYRKNRVITFEPHEYSNITAETT